MNHSTDAVARRFFNSPTGKQYIAANMAHPAYVDLKYKKTIMTLDYYRQTYANAKAEYDKTMAKTTRTPTDQAVISAWNAMERGEAHVQDYFTRPLPEPKQEEAKKPKAPEIDLW